MNENEIGKIIVAGSFGSVFLFDIRCILAWGHRRKNIDLR